MKENIIINKTFQFALDIIEYCETLNDLRKYIANQLLKSGTSIGANIREAQNAESKNDFIHKFKIAAKEIEETNYWLLLCKFSKKISRLRPTHQRFKRNRKYNEQNYYHF